MKYLKNKMKTVKISYQKKLSKFIKQTQTKYVVPYLGQMSPCAS